MFTCTLLNPIKKVEFYLRTLRACQPTTIQEAKSKLLNFSGCKPETATIAVLASTLFLDPNEYHRRWNLWFGPRHQVGVWYNWMNKQFPGKWTTTSDELDVRWNANQKFLTNLNKINPHSIKIELAFDSYLKFITLLKENPGKKLVPSFEIDLIWHSHMLDHPTYVKDMKNYFGYIIHHNDTVEIVSKQVDDTRNLWENRFGMKMPDLLIATTVGGGLSFKAMQQYQPPPQQQQQQQQQKSDSSGSGCSSSTSCWNSCQTCSSGSCSSCSGCSGD